VPGGSLLSGVGLVHYALRNQIVYVDGCGGVQPPLLSKAVPGGLESRLETMGRSSEVEIGLGPTFTGSRAAA
jgi:hypothetical protein